MDAEFMPVIFYFSIDENRENVYNTFQAGFWKSVKVRNLPGVTSGERYI